MNSQMDGYWCRKYAARLRQYLGREQEALLQEAYELGRHAIARGVGILDMARIHQQAAAHCLWRAGLLKGPGKELAAAEAFFLETLAPFEAAHRGFRLVNLQLHRVNQALAESNHKLARTNRDLQREVAERKRTEKALRVSEEHYRRLFHQARFMQENLRNLSTQILHVQEEERKRVSRELHDEVGQALTAISTQLEMIQKNAANGTPRAGPRIADTQGLLAQTMETVHRFARELRPPILDELGLLPALRSYLRSFAERTGLRVRFSSGPEPGELSGEQKTVVFRVAQESLTNVAKHARAGRVAISFRKLKSGVRLRIRDDGQGFQTKEQLLVNGKKRLGLLGMHERVRLVNGRFAVMSTPGKGTTISIEIPFRPAAGVERQLPAATPRRATQPKSSHETEQECRVC